MAEDTTRGDRRACRTVVQFGDRSIQISASAIIFAGVLLIGITASHTTSAHSFRDQLKNKLDSVCDDNSLQRAIILAQSANQIQQRYWPCRERVFVYGASPEGAGILSIEQRLQSTRETEEEKLESRRGRRTYALDTAGRIAQSDGLQLPPAGGATPSVVFGLGQGVSVFFSAGAYAVDHFNNRFEDGYEAQLPTVTVGGDYKSMIDCSPDLHSTTRTTTAPTTTAVDSTSTFSALCSTRVFCRRLIPFAPGTRDVVTGGP